MKKLIIRIQKMLLAILMVVFSLFSLILLSFSYSPNNITNKIKVNNSSKKNSENQRINDPVDLNNKIDVQRIYRSDKVITTYKNQGLDILGKVNKIQFFGMPTFETNLNTKQVHSFGLKKILVSKNGGYQNFKLQTFYADVKNDKTNSFIGQYSQNNKAAEEMNSNSGILVNDINNFTNVSLGLVTTEAPQKLKNIQLEFSSEFNNYYNQNTKISDYLTSMGSIYIQSGTTIYRSQSNLKLKNFINANNLFDLNSRDVKWSVYIENGVKTNAFITIPTSKNLQENYFSYTNDDKKFYSIPTPILNYSMKYHKKNTTYAQREEILQETWNHIKISAKKLNPLTSLDFALVTRDKEIIKNIIQLSSNNAIDLKKKKYQDMDSIELVSNINKNLFFKYLTITDETLSLGFSMNTKDTSAVTLNSLIFLNSIEWTPNMQLKNLRLYLKHDLKLPNSQQSLNYSINPQHFSSKKMNIIENFEYIKNVFFENNESDEYLPLKIFDGVENINIRTKKLASLDISTFTDIVTYANFEQKFNTNKNYKWLNASKKGFILWLPSYPVSSIKFTNFLAKPLLNQAKNHIVAFIKSTLPRVPAKPELIWNPKTYKYSISSIKVNGNVIHGKIINGTLNWDFYSPKIDSTKIGFSNSELTEFYTQPTSQEIKNKKLISVNGIPYVTPDPRFEDNINDPITFSNNSFQDIINVDNKKYGIVIANGVAVWNYDITNIQYSIEYKNKKMYFSTITSLIRTLGKNIISSGDIKIMNKTNLINNKNRDNWTIWAQEYNEKYIVPNPSLDTPSLYIDNELMDKTFIYNGKQVWDWEAYKKGFDVSAIKWVYVEKGTKIIPHLYTKPLNSNGDIRRGIYSFNSKIVKRSKQESIQFVPWIFLDKKDTIDTLKKKLEKKTIVDGNPIEWKIQKGKLIFDEYRNFKYAAKYFDSNSLKWNYEFFTNQQSLNSFIKRSELNDILYKINTIKINAKIVSTLDDFKNRTPLELTSSDQTITVDNKKVGVKLNKGILYWDLPKTTIKYKYLGEFYTTLEKIKNHYGSSFDITLIESINFLSTLIPGTNFENKIIFNNNISNYQEVIKKAMLIDKGVVIDGIRYKINIYNSKIVLNNKFPSIKYIIQDSKTKEFIYYTSFDLIPLKYRTSNFSVLNSLDKIFSFKTSKKMFYTMQKGDSFSKVRKPTSMEDFIILRIRINGVITDKKIYASNYTDPITNKKYLIWSNPKSIKQIMYYDGKYFYKSLEVASIDSSNFTHVKSVNYPILNLNIIINENANTKNKKDEFLILIYPVSFIFGILGILFIIKIILILNNKRKIKGGHYDQK